MPNFLLQVDQGSYKMLKRDTESYLKKYTAGLGQEAEQLPPDWKCYTEAEVELIISRLSLDIRAKLTPEEFKKVELCLKEP